MTFITALSDGRPGNHNSYHGPFNPSGNTKYIPLLDSTLRKIGMAKATLLDPGDGDWSQVAADISVSGSSDIVSLWAFHDPGNSRIGIGTAQSNGDLRYHEFNTGTEAWDISDEVIRQVAAAPDQYITAATRPAICVSPRDDGDVVCVHNGTETGGSGPHGVYRAIRTTSWVSKAKQQNSGVEISLIAGINNGSSASDYQSFLIQRGSTDLRRGSISTGTTFRITDTGVSFDTAHFAGGCGARRASDDQVVFPYIDNNNDVSTVEWDGNDNNSTVTYGDNKPVGDQGAAAYNGATTQPYPMACCVFDGSNVHLFYVPDSDKDIWHVDDATGTSGTETKVVSGISAEHLSVGMSANNQDALILWRTSVNTAVFRRVTINATVSKPLFPVIIQLHGRRVIGLDDPDQPPSVGLELPPVEGATIWEQDWSGCILTPIWDVSSSPQRRGAIGFDTMHDKICAEPGRLYSFTHCGTFETLTNDSNFSPNNALQCLVTRTQYNTLDDKGNNRTHTNWSPTKSIWLPSDNQQICFPQLQVCKISWFMELRRDFLTSGNNHWTILMQTKSWPNPGARNPTLALKSDNQRFWMRERGDSIANLQSSEYDNEGVWIDCGAIISGQIDLWELKWLADYRDPSGDTTTHDLPAAGFGWYELKRNGNVVASRSGVKIGYNAPEGQLLNPGAYHYFNNSGMDEIEVLFGPVRLEVI